MNPSDIKFAYAKEEDISKIALMHMDKKVSGGPEDEMVNFYRDKIDFLFVDKNNRILVAKKEEVLAGFIIFAKNASQFDKSIWGLSGLKKWIANFIKGRYGFSKSLLNKCLNIFRYKLSVKKTDGFTSALPCAKIIAIIVDDKFRGMGIGKGLIEKAVEELKNDGIGLLSVTALPKNSAAVHLYKGLGFKDAGFVWESTGKNAILVRELK